MPRTRPGRWSVGLAGAFFAGLFLLRLLVALGQEGGKGFFSNIPLALAGISAAAAGVATLVVGVVAIVRRRERSPLVFLATFVGLVVTWFLIGEVVTPH